MDLQGFPLSCHKAIDLLRLDLKLSMLVISHCNHISVLGCRPSPTHPVSYLQTYRTKVARFNFSEVLLIIFFLFLLNIFFFPPASSSSHVQSQILFPFQHCSCTPVKQWGQLVGSCLNGKEMFQIGFSVTLSLFRFQSSRSVLFYME